MQHLAPNRPSAPTIATRGAGGFTLLELMVALTVGGFAVASIYAVGAASTRTFQQQQQIATAQTALRMALNQVKRDIARAGYLATPNINSIGQSCGQIAGLIDSAGTLVDQPAGTGRLAGISAFQNDVAMVTNGPTANDGVDPTGNNAANGFTTDGLVLFGNYETASEYPGVTLVSPTQIGIDQNWYGFQRDFTDWFTAAPTGFNATAFNDAFTVGRLIRIQTSRQARHFATITAVAGGVGGGPVLVTFNPAIPATCVADVNGGWAAPVSALRYFARNATGTEAERFNTTVPVAQLIRQEVRPGDKVTPANDRLGNPIAPRAILDYLVEFNLAFTMTTAHPPLSPDVYVAGSTTNVANTVNTNPEWVRSVTIDLAARSPQQDPSLLWTQATCANLLCFEAVPSAQQPGATRVRRMRSEVFLPNVAYEGY